MHFKNNNYHELDQTVPAQQKLAQNVTAANSLYLGKMESMWNWG